MRFIGTLLAIAVVLLASCDNLAATATTITNKQDGLYAQLYRVKDGVVTDKMRIPLGEVEQYKDSDFNQPATKLGANGEERAAPRPNSKLVKLANSIFKGVERFVGLFRKSKRRLRIQGA